MKSIKAIGRREKKPKMQRGEKFGRYQVHFLSCDYLFSTISLNSIPLINGKGKNVVVNGIGYTLWTTTSAHAVLKLHRRFLTKPKAETVFSNKVHNYPDHPTYEQIPKQED